MECSDKFEREQRTVSLHIDEIEGSGTFVALLVVFSEEKVHGQQIQKTSELY